MAVTGSRAPRFEEVTDEQGRRLELNDMLEDGEERRHAARAHDLGPVHRANTL